ncbi:MAG: hypothetical protein R2911_41345 [Caldilineaceae bacterium]
MGIPDTVTAQSLMQELPDRADGAYLALANGADQGLMKLLPWSFALDEFPDRRRGSTPATCAPSTSARRGWMRRSAISSSGSTPKKRCRCRRRSLLSSANCF